MIKLSGLGIFAAMNTIGGVENGDNNFILEGPEKKDGVGTIIDCGSTTFHKLDSLGFFKDLTHINVIVSHTHDDHVGSLGRLILKFHYEKKFVTGLDKNITLYAPTAIADDIRTLCRIYGCPEFMYNLVEIDTSVTIEGISVTPVPVTHVAFLQSYAFVLKAETDSVYYSADSNMIPVEVLADFKGGKINRIYQDVAKSNYPGNVHLWINHLCDLIPEEMRHRVYCMHLDSTFDIKEAKDLKFQVAEVIQTVTK